MTKNNLCLEISEDDSDLAYLYFPGHPGKGEKNIVSRQIRLCDIIENYNGPDLYLDIDHGGKVIGLEILAG